MASNRFEEIGRARKVDRFVSAMDERMEAAGIDPRDPGVADGLAKWSLDAWVALAEDMKEKKEPSADSIAAVIEFYRNRARRGDPRDVRRSA